MEFDFTNAVVSFLSGGSFVAVLQLIKWYIELRRKDKCQSKAILTTIDDVRKIYEYLHHLQENTPANRAMVMKAEDSGEIPVLGKQIFSSIVYDSSKTGHSWDRQLCDRPYIEMLCNIDASSKLDVVVDDLSDCDIKTFCIAEGVALIRAFSVYATDGRFFYLCINFPTTDELSPHDKDTIRVHVNAIRELFKRSNEALHT